MEKIFFLFDQKSSFFSLSVIMIWSVGKVHCRTNLIFFQRRKKNEKLNNYLHKDSIQNFLAISFFFCNKMTLMFWGNKILWSYDGEVEREGEREREREK